MSLKSRSAGAFWVLAGIPFVIAAGVYSPRAHSEDMQPVWQASACYNLTLSVRDKLAIRPAFRARYVVKGQGPEDYVAERTVSGSSNPTVTFPDDFRGQRTKLQAYADCFDGQKYTWQIYADEVLIDSGILEFHRDRKKKGKR